MIGLAGFNGGRLCEAREARGLSKVALSGLVDVSSQSISNYETGAHAPTVDTATALARALNFPLEFFLLGDRSTERAPIFYRSLASATKGARLRAEHRFTWLRDLVDWVTVDVGLPPPDLPDLGLPDDPLCIDDADIEDAAARVRDAWRLGDGPIPNTVAVVEHHGTVVAHDVLDATSLDSMSEVDPVDGRPYILVSTDKGTAVRWRFDVAHELGHVLLHHAVPPAAVARSETHKLMEHQAHRFAGAFLLPAAPFGDDLFGTNLDAFLAVKAKWRVSVGMMIVQARHAGFISEATEKSLWVMYNRRKWRKNEPLDDEIPTEQPRLLSDALDMIWDLGERTTDDLAAALSLPATDLERMAYLPAGSLVQRPRHNLQQHQAPNVLQFPTRGG